MNTPFFISSLVGIFISFFTLVYVVLKTYKEKKQIKSDYEHRYSSWDLSRDRIEEDMYNMIDTITSPQSILDTSSSLFLSIPQKEHELSNKLMNESFFSDLGIKLGELNVVEKQVLCIMPFHRKFEPRYQAVGFACKSANLKCIRSDEMDATGRVLNNIVELILTSQVVVAIMDGRNPNVFYEIGIAHALGKPVLLLMQNSEKNNIPFDLSSNYVIIYNDLNDLSFKLGSRLKALQK